MPVGERILIVDDNPANVKLMSFILSARGYDIHTATNATEALATLEHTLPRLILMDVQLPGMDGLELTARLKADPKTCAIIIVAVTAYAMTGDEQKARNAGCDGYITKPIDKRTLPATVAAYLASGMDTGTATDTTTDTATERTAV
jgi:CheY-like chemotaxis protein